MSEVSLREFLSAKKSSQPVCIVCRHPEREAIDQALSDGCPAAHIAAWARLHTDYPMSDVTMLKHKREGHSVDRSIRD